MPSLRLFCGQANKPLAGAISDYLGVPLGKITSTQFPDGERFIRLDEDVRGKDVFVIQPTSFPANDNLMELLIFIDSARRASAERITAVIPYFGYARQDRKDEGRTPITAKLVANLIATAGADRVLTMDLHAAQIQGFFDIPVDNLHAEPVLSRYFLDKKFKNIVLVSPDAGNTRRARVYADHFRGELAVIDKHRLTGSTVEVGRIIGEVEGKTVLMMDDMITTAGTIRAAADLCAKNGASAIYVGATHGVLCSPAAERLRDAPITEIVVTDTIPISDATVEAIGKLTVLTVAGLMGEAIHRIHNDESVSSLFFIEGNRSQA